MILRRVAVFDIDGTIFRSSLLIELVEILIEEGIFPKNSRYSYSKEEFRWLNRQGVFQQSDYERYINKVVKAFVDNIKGVSFGDFENAVNVVMDRHQNRVYRFTRDLVKSLKKKNYYLLAISQSPKLIVDAFCKKLGFNKVYGRIYEVDENKKFTGKVQYLEEILDKAKILSRAIKKEGLTLKGSFGVGDTESDIAFLKMVENPICFNPNLKLYKHACSKKWKIVVERKDVVYDI